MPLRDGCAVGGDVLVGIGQVGVDADGRVDQVVKMSSSPLENVNSSVALVPGIRLAENQGSFMVPLTLVLPEGA
ncbi:MAG: hypothetical protein ACLRM9_00345 [Collinsella aerofaciens]